MPSDSQDGAMLDLFGQRVYPANPSRSQGKDSRKTTSVTSSRSSRSWSESVGLSESLGNRFRKRLALDGSTEYKMSWKRKGTPAGRLYFQLVASGRRTSDNGYGGWATPRTITGGGESSDRKQELGRTESGGSDIQAQAEMSGWATPRAEDSESCGMRHSRGKADTMSSQAGQDLVSGWPTAMSRDWKDTPGTATTGVNPDGSTRTRLDQLPRVANLLIGHVQHGSTAVTGNQEGYRLNPYFSAWVMGYPRIWTELGLKMVSRLQKGSKGAPRS